MAKTIHFISFITILTLVFSCAETKSAEKEADKTEFKSILETDTLKFSSGIRAIFQDSKGNYWFGSLKEGVARYSGTSFTYFTQHYGLSDNQIHSIQEDSEGRIWFNTQNGVSTYDGRTIKNQTKTAAPTPQGEWMKSENDLWFGAGIREGVLRYDGQSLRYLAFPSHEVSNPYDNLFAITDISKGADNMIWLGTYAGIWGYNGSDFTVINDASLGLDRKTDPLHIRSILEDSKGRLWIGNNGIGVLLKEGDTIINFSEKMNLKQPASSRGGDKSPAGTLEHVFAIAEDADGNIWFGDRDTGVWKYDGANMVNYTLKDGLTNDFALSIYNDKNGQLWLGMADGGVYTFKGKTFQKMF